jgi:hypothetical protein
MLGMSFLSNNINYFKDLDKIPKSINTFLEGLNGLTIIDIVGKNTNKTRVVTTLIHGNEPSGIIACHKWLLTKSVPYNNVRIIICNPEAAQITPIFSHRYIAGTMDLNRCFLPNAHANTEMAKRAKDIVNAINEVSPVAIIDIHNTSGTSPSFGVATENNEENLSLIDLFTDKTLITEKKVGAVMEVDFKAPIVSIESGGANELLSHEVAYLGVQRFFESKEIFKSLPSSVVVFKKPARVQLNLGLTVAFSQCQLTDSSVVLRADIEKLNHHIVAPGEVLGWTNSEISKPLTAINAQNIDIIDNIIEVQRGQLVTKCKLQLFMATTIKDIATHDCLFYACVVDRNSER